MSDNVQIEILKPFPAKSNPYHHDLERMGVDVNKEIVAMFHLKNNIIILFDKVTGKRVEVTFPRPVKVPTPKNLLGNFC